MSTLLELEKRERSGKVALETLRRAARAMGCDVVYAIVPTEASTLEALVQQRAQQAARRMVARTEASMKLEDQGVHRDETLAQESELAEALKESLSPALWEEPR